MSSPLLALGALLVVSFGVLAVAVWRAREGYEDGEGYHDVDSTGNG